MVALISIVIVADEVAAQSTEITASHELSVLLESDKALDLRKARKIIEERPSEALPLFSTISRRANHPELTQAFHGLLRHASLRQLLWGMRDAAPQQRAVLIQEIKARDSGQRSRSSAPTYVPQRGRTAKEKGATDAVVEIKNARQTTSCEEIQKRLSETLRRYALQESDWNFIFSVIDGDQFEIEKGYTSRHLWIEGAVTKHATRDSEPIYRRFLDPTTKQPERLISIIASSGPRPEAVKHRIFELAKSEDPKIRKIALRSFPASKTRSDEYAEAVFAWAKDDPSEVRAYALALGRCGKYASYDTKRKILDWLLRNIENEASVIRNPTGVPDRRLNFFCSNWSEILARDIEPGGQVSSVRWIAEMAEKSEHPMQYLKVLDTYACDLSDATPFLKRMLAGCDDPKDALIYHRLLCRSGSGETEAFSAFENAIKAPTEDWETIELACLGVQVLGPKAHALLPRLIQLAEDAEEDAHRVKVIAAIGAIGPEASGVIPDLLRLFRARAGDGPQFLEYRRSEIIRAFGSMGPKAEGTVPLLLSIAGRRDAESSNLRSGAINALIKIAPEDPDVREKMKGLSNDPTVNPFFKEEILDYLSK